MFAPTVLPPQRPCFPAVLDKPPGSPLSKKVLTDVGKIFSKTVMGPVTEDKPPGAVITVFDQSRAENFFTPRPLQLLVFCDRAAPHHSIILQIDGLIFACFRLRLERDVCAQSFDDSFCMSFGPGVSLSEPRGYDSIAVTKPGHLLFVDSICLPLFYFVVLFKR